MAINSTYIIIILCGLVIISYLYNIVSKLLKIPSVLLLIATGIGLRYLGDFFDITLGENVNRIVEILGSIGLIMIVLEGSLDLKLTKNKIGLIRSSFFSAFIILAVSCVLITFALYFAIGGPLHHCLVYSIPLSVISSAVAIPSAENLDTEQREFIIYESTFSDIVGIVFFNYFTMREIFTAYSLLSFGQSILLVVLISAFSSLALLLLVNKIKSHVKFFLVLAVLVLLYTLGKAEHLPTLLMVLCFGLMINNLNLVVRGKTMKRFFHEEDMEPLTAQLKLITAESCFVIRTFFFVLFGYSIDLLLLVDTEVLQTGSMIVAILLMVRFFYLKLVLKTKLIPKLFILPRGLISIVLFYGIPKMYIHPEFNKGILLFVIIVTGLLMTLGLLLFKKEAEKVVEGDIL